MVGIMNNQFELQKTNNESYPFISLSLCYYRVDQYLEDIEDKLVASKYNGKVIFDLVMSNGLNDRFYEAYFNGRKFDGKSFSAVKNIDDTIESISKNFYLNNISFLENSVLTKPQKFLFKKSLSR